MPLKTVLATLTLAFVLGLAHAPPVPGDIICNSAPVEPGMKYLRLSMRGGIYGTLELEPVDPCIVGPQFAEEALAVLEENESTAEDGRGVAMPAAPGVRTERQTISFEIIRDDGERRVYSFDESSLNAEPRLKSLFETLWKHSRPRPSE